jgi:hypothetical protein
MASPERLQPFRRNQTGTNCEVQRFVDHVELSLTDFLQRVMKKSEKQRERKGHFGADGVSPRLKTVMRNCCKT